MALNKAFGKAPSVGQNDFVGTIKCGEQVNGRPVMLDSWKVISDDPNVVKALQEHLGGDISTFMKKDVENHQIHNLGEVLKVKLTTVKSRFALKGANFQTLRTCDGTTQYDDKKSPCACPNNEYELKADPAGCKPDIFMVMRIEGAEDLGKFRFYSASWGLAKEVNALEEALEENGGEALAEMSVVTNSYTTKNGQSRQTSYPSVKVLQSVSS